MKNTLFCLLIIVCFSLSAKALVSENDTLKARYSLQIADSLYELNKYNAAIPYYRNASELFAKAKDFDLVCHCKIWETYMYIDLEKYNEALENINEAIEYFNLLFPTNNIYSFKCALKKSLVYYSQENYPYSVVVLDDAIKTFLISNECKTEEGKKEISSAYFEYANNLLNLGKLDSCILLYEETLNLRIELYPANHALIIDCYNNLGIAYSCIGNYDIAESYMLKALRARELEMGFAHPQTAWSYTNMAIFYLYQKNYEKALEFAFKGLEARKEALPENHLEFGSSYATIANIYNETGDFNKALEYHNKALELYIAKLGKNNYKVARIYNNIADNYNKQSELEASLEYFLKAYSILNKLSPDDILQNQIQVNYNIADTYLKLGQTDSALIYNNYIYSNYLEPLGSLNQDLSALLGHGFIREIIEQKAQIYFALYKKNNSISDLKIAYEAYLYYFDILDFLRLRISEVDSKVNLLRLNSSFINSAVDISYLLHKADSVNYPINQTAQIIDKSKAGVLQEMIEKTVFSKSGVPDSLIMQWNSITKQLQALKTKQKSSHEKNQIKHNNELEVQKIEFQEKLYQLNKEIFANHSPLSTNFGYSTYSSDSSFNINENTAILDYFISDTTLYISVFTDQKVSVLTSTIDSNFEDLVNKYLSCIKKNRTYNFDPLSSQLYDYLIQPALELLSGKDRLIIIPDKYLHYLPFETLCKAEMKSNFRDKSYLIRDYTISYHFSTSIYQRYTIPETSDLGGKKSFAGFAPVFEKKNKTLNLSSECLTYLSDTTLIKNDMLRTVSIDGKTYSSLPYSEQEVSKIFDLFKSCGKQSSEFLYENANEKVFKSQVQNFDIIHLASHGIINEQSPNLSAILFYPDTLSSKDYYEDNILMAGEMYNLNLNASLVVLSACETGLGAYVNGEGIMSMTRGIIYAGANNVLYSLWKVGDNSTYKLMLEFYKNYLKGYTYSEALREAKLSLISNEETAFPRFWGGFVLLGNH